MRWREYVFPVRRGAARITALHNTTWYTYPDAPYKWTPEYEGIIDDPHRTWIEYGGRKKRFNKMKPVYHTKFRNILDEAQFWIHTTDPSWYWGGNPPARLSQYWNQSDLTETLVAELLGNQPLESTGHYDRWQTTRPTISTRLNLTVAALELADIKKMVDVIPGRHLQYRSKRCRGWREAYEWMRYGNGLHLNYNFGWKPFVNDIVNAIDTATKFRQRMTKLENQADQTLRRTFRDDPVDLSNTKIVNSPAGYSGETIKYVFKGTAQHASVFHYAYTLPQYGKEELELRAIADAVGFRPDIATVWELIPKSFVVDWAWDVGGYLETFRNDWVAPWLTWYQCCYSQKFFGSLETSVGIPNYPYTVIYYKASTLQLKRYTRKLGLPQFSGTTGNLDADKIRLGASLLFGSFGTATPTRHSTTRKGL